MVLRVAEDSSHDQIFEYGLGMAEILVVLDALSDLSTAEFEWQGYKPPAQDIGLKQMKMIRL